MTSIEKFIQLLEIDFEDPEITNLSPNTNYKDIPDFSSMHALIIIAHIDNEYDVLLSGQDLKATNTLQDLYELVKQKI